MWREKGVVDPSARPKLDLEAVQLPLPLPETPLPSGDELARRWLGALGPAAGPSLRSVAAGQVPLHAFAGNTIFLAFSHFDLAGGIYAREQVTYHRPVGLEETLTVAQGGGGHPSMYYLVSMKQTPDSMLITAVAPIAAIPS